MRDDLQGLEITPKELQKLTNLPVNNDLILIVNPMKGLARQYIEKLKGSEGVTVFFIGFSGFVFSYILLDVFIKMFAAWMPIPSWILLIILSFFGLGTAQTLLYFLWKKRTKILQENVTHSLKTILMDVERYNSVIKAIHINDEIEAAGNPGVNIKERNRVLEALELTRSDLIRALKTEKILRENKNFIISNTELFANNLATLTAMQASEQASEHGRLLNEALQIALDVQHEMRRLQSHR